ncbi:MAG: hypothetical protein PHY48_09220 [Candidatus Cloacimonetes bacterium]|nr:hypothetical protein [Candidatus Cloacimonadota bacterium]MDD4027390.1 hypothetical protein [Candidatus Shapirobacteria bacterium]
MKYWLYAIFLIVITGTLHSVEIAQQTDSFQNQLIVDSLDSVSKSDTVSTHLSATYEQSDNMITGEEQPISKNKQKSKKSDVSYDDSDHLDTSATEHEKQTANDEGLINFVVPILIILAVILLLRLFDGFARKCKKCGRMWAAKEINSKVLDRWMGSKTIKRTDIVKDNNGQQTNTIEREETVQVFYSKVLHTYQCKYCGIVWSREETHEN